MKKSKTKFKSIKTKLLFSFSTTIIIIILFLVFINSIILEPFYTYSKIKSIKKVYTTINSYYNENKNIDLVQELKASSIENNFDILLKTNQDLVVISLGKDVFFTMEEMIYIAQRNLNSGNIIQKDDNMIIQRINENNKNDSYILLTGKLDNGYLLYIRIAVSPIQESVKISNRLFILIGTIAMAIAATFSIIIAKKFTKPILELNDIAKKMAKQDFSQMYNEQNEEDEINTLGRNINIMSNELKLNIEKLKQTNIELEQDIEKKSKIDEMRKQFISDVSHELKTPISLIQGYAEGLIENVNTDSSARNYYSEVILDESKKMDLLVKKLLDLLRIEYAEQKPPQYQFNLMAMIETIIKKYDVVLKENNILIDFEGKKEEILVYADEFSIEQVFTNYFVNAVKYIEEYNNEKIIIIKFASAGEKLRVSVFNTGNNIADEDIERIWKRFYKIDASRNRDKGGSGIGLSIVKAIMNNYKNDYGVINKENGVEFYFDIDLMNS